MQVTKRDGRVVPFMFSKIKSAIEKAGAPELLAEKIAQAIEDTGKDYTVEEIQDMIEKKLMASAHKEAAQNFIRYRERRTIHRRYTDPLNQLMRKKLDGSNNEMSNANVDEISFGGKKGELTNTYLKQYALDNDMSEMSRDNHINNEIYIHDLCDYSLGEHNCMSIPYDDLLAKGFKTRQVDIRPANSINTALQLVAVIAQIQSLQEFGGVAATHLDWTMVPYVRKSFFRHWKDGRKYLLGDENADELVFFSDKSITDEYYQSNKAPYTYAMDMTKREMNQACEGLLHNLNSLQSRSGNQLPFTSINYGTCTLPEGRMFIESILRATIKGVGPQYLTPVFPCQIFKMKAGCNRHEGDPNYDLFKLALECTAKRLYPNYANVDWSGNAGYDPNDPCTEVATMGCRTYNGFDINGFGQLKDGRGNICPVTIIMPTLAAEVRDIIEPGWTSNDGTPRSTPKSVLVDAFMKRLDLKIHEAKDMLLERFEHICSQPMESARFMYENNIMAGYIPEEGIRSALKHGTLAIGQLGLAETLQLLIGCDQTTEEGMVLARRIEQLFKDRAAEFKHEYSLNFGVYMTPAEGLCHTALNKFRERYGIIPNVSDKKFFTNSIHVPVWQKVDVFRKIDIESELDQYSSAGCILYVELDSGVKNNLEAVETLVNYAMDKDVPYFAINVPNDQCRDCGYTNEFNDCCPACGSKNILQLRRVTGYLTSNYKTAFNLGKQDEVEHRVKHTGQTENYVGE